MVILQLQMSDIIIRRISEEDIPAVAQIELSCFSEPWSEKSLSLLTDGRGVGFVALVDGIIVGYGGMMTVLDEGQITNIAVLPEFRRLGLGRSLVQALQKYAKSNEFSLLSLEVRESNIPAISLYEVCGWEKQGIRKGFYRFPSEAAVIMTWSCH